MRSSNARRGESERKAALIGDGIHWRARGEKCDRDRVKTLFESD